MESREQGIRRPIDRKFVGWHVFYSFILIAFGLLFLVADDNCVGREPGYWFLGFGGVPSLTLLVVGLLRPMTAYKAAMLYGAVMAIGAGFLAATTPNAMWVALLFPLFGFIAEAAVIIWRWRRISEVASNGSC